MRCKDSARIHGLESATVAIRVSTEVPDQPFSAHIATNTSTALDDMRCPEASVEISGASGVSRGSGRTHWGTDVARAPSLDEFL